MSRVTWFGSRWAVWRAILRLGGVRIAAGLWVLSTLYDFARSELIPPAWDTHAPRLLSLIGAIVASRWWFSLVTLALFAVVLEGTFRVVVDQRDKSFDTAKRTKSRAVLTIQAGDGEEFEATIADPSFKWSSHFGPLRELSPGAVIQEKLVRIRNEGEEAALECRVKLIVDHPFPDAKTQYRSTLEPLPRSLLWRDTRSAQRTLYPGEQEHVVLDRQVITFGGQGGQPWGLANGSSGSTLEIATSAENVSEPVTKRLQVQFGEFKEWMKVKELP